MALLSYQQIDIIGTAKTYVTPTATIGDAVYPDDRGFVNIKNGSGAAITATLVVPGNLYGQARPDVAVSIPAGGDRSIGPMNADFADPADGQIDVICSAVASVTIAALRI